MKGITGLFLTFALVAVLVGCAGTEREKISEGKVKLEKKCERLLSKEKGLRKNIASMQEEVNEIRIELRKTRKEARQLEIEINRLDRKKSG